MPFSYVTLLPDERIFKAVNVVLSLQNGDGGWATYELMRGPALLEHLNPSETFHGIMVDYPYVECSSACVQALARFQQHYPGHRSAEIKYELELSLHGVVRCSSLTRWCTIGPRSRRESSTSCRSSDLTAAGTSCDQCGNRCCCSTSLATLTGCRKGSWGVCFTYAIWFGVEALLASGRPHTDPAYVATLLLVV